MAIICLKNVVRRNWTNRGSSDDSCVLTAQEKNGLKEYLLGYECLYIKDEKVWRQVCSLVAIVARLDWPEAVSRLLQMRENVRKDEELRAETRVLCVLAHVLEVLSEKRLPQARKAPKATLGRPKRPPKRHPKEPQTMISY